MLAWNSHNSGSNQKQRIAQNVKTVQSVFNPSKRNLDENEAESNYEAYEDEAARSSSQRLLLQLNLMHPNVQDRTTIGDV